MRIPPLSSLHEFSQLYSAAPLAITALASAPGDAVTLPLPPWLRWCLGGGVSLTGLGIAWWWIKPRVIALVRSTVAEDLAQIDEMRAAVQEALATAQEANDMANRTHDAMRMMLERQDTDRRELSATISTMLEMVRQIARRMDTIASHAPSPSAEIPPR